VIVPKRKGNKNTLNWKLSKSMFFIYGENMMGYEDNDNKNRIISYVKKIFISVFHKIISHMEKTGTVKDCKVGSYIMIEGEPCKVVSYAKSKPGKHGAAKVRIEAIGVFDGKKRTLLKPADAEVSIPIIEKKKAQVISVSGDMAQLMDLETYETFDALIPEEFKGKIEPGRDVLYWKMGNRVLIKQLS